MSTTPTPFDNILSSGNGATAAQAATSQAAATPFDDILPSTQQSQQANPDQTASDTRQMLVSGLTGIPTPNMTDADRASFATGKAAGAGTATLLSAAPLLGALAPHLPDLNKAWKIAALLGGSSATVDHLLSVLGVLNGKHK